MGPARYVAVMAAAVAAALSPTQTLGQDLYGTGLYGAASKVRDGDPGPRGASPPAWEGGLLVFNAVDDLALLSSAGWQKGTLHVRDQDATRELGSGAVVTRLLIGYRARLGRGADVLVQAGGFLSIAERWEVREAGGDGPTRRIFGAAGPAAGAAVRVGGFLFFGLYQHDARPVRLEQERLVGRKSGVSLGLALLSLSP